MSTTFYLIQAQQLLELALEQARQERDRGVFELARGERSLQHLQRLVERVALVQGLWQQVRSLLGAQEQPPPPTRFRPGEHWRSPDGLYRVEACPLVPSCIRLIPLSCSAQEPLYRHPSNTSRFQRLWP